MKARWNVGRRRRGTWSDRVGPLTCLSDTSRHMLSLGLATFFSRQGSYPGMLMAAMVGTTIPIIILFSVTQRTSIRGMALAGIKGQRTPCDRAGGLGVWGCRSRAQPIGG